jgi:hypothetical protein
MQDKDFLIESYQERFWQYQTKELNRSYRRLTLQQLPKLPLVYVLLSF